MTQEGRGKKGKKGESCKSVMADREVGYDTVVKERRGDMESQKWMLRSNLMVKFRMIRFSIF